MNFSKLDQLKILFTQPRLIVYVRICAKSWGIFEKKKNFYFVCKGMLDAKPGVQTELRKLV